MSKYIDVESLIDSLEKCQYDIEDSIYDKGFGKATETMLGILRAYPTANVAPIADTVRKMESLLIDEVFKVARCQLTCDEPNVTDQEVRAIIKRIAKEMLEGETNEKQEAD